MTKNFCFLFICLITCGGSSFFVWDAVDTGQIVFRGVAEVDANPLGFWIKVSIMVLIAVITLASTVHTLLAILRKLKANN
ncbi:MULTISPECIES: hypothetical protein [unclassified Oleiphilus]|uniref:hypothetical protein n=1 Tax=unclassified Oleiphilus TaxID=2631174 RepID=UPI0012E71B59|nr:MULTISPECIES: hypothetical protein [unclassified Oleiphilus]